MRCQTCDYPLWRTTRRACTECGTAYRVADCRFRPGAVRFSCPYCQKGYYGTSPNGLLEPAEFECVCGKRISMEEMSVEPAPGVDEQATGGPVNPWVERSRLGLFRAWLRSVFAVLGDPAGFIRSMPSSTPTSEGVLFAGISAGLGVAMGIGLMLIGWAILALVLQSASGTIAMARASMLAATQALTLQIANGVLTVVCCLLAGFVAHAVLVVLRGAKVGLGRSMPAILFTQGATSALNFVACCPCNSIVAPIWWCIAMTMMLRVIHHASLGRAVTASIIAALTWMGATLAVTTMLSTTVTGTSTSFVNTTSVRGDDFHTKTGCYPTPFVTLGGLDREALDAADLDRIEAIARRIESILPPKNAPFRLGRAVFAYRDATDESTAWHVIIIPSDAGMTEADEDGEEWTVIRSRGVVTYDHGSFQSRLDRENERRSAGGVSAIPDPLSLPDLLLAPSLQDPLPSP